MLPTAFQSRPHAGSAGGRALHPDRRPTLLLTENFAFIQRLQAMVGEDRNLPAIDHGMLASAALSLVEEMSVDPHRVIDRALDLIVERRRAVRSV